MAHTHSPLPIAKPILDEREVDAVRRVILSGWVTQGPEVAAFEREFAAYVGAPHAVAVSNCTTALHLALLAAGVGPGDEVITVSHSFIATANAVRYCDATPVFVDIVPGTFNMDPARLDAAVTSRTKAILCVHQLGMPCDLSAIGAVARRRGITVIEDAACAIGSELQWNGVWEKIGKPHADIACFSFHPRKVITTGDGGMLTTANPDYAAKFRLWRQHSMSVPDTVRHGSREVVFEGYPEVGFNYRMTDLQAAVGRTQLTRLPEIIEERRRLAAAYRKALGTIPGLGLPHEPAYARSNWQSFCIRLPHDADQKVVMQHLLDCGISTRRAVMNAHEELAYPAGTFRTVGSPASALTNSTNAKQQGIMLPLFPGMTEENVRTVAETLMRACRSEQPVAGAAR